MGRVDGRPLEVRPHHRRDRRRGREAPGRRACSTACSSSTSTSARRSRPSAPSRTPCARPAASSSSCTPWAPTCATRLRRRPGRRLRRQPDQLPLVGQLHAAEYASDIVSQVARGLQRQGRAPSRHRHRVGPGPGGPSLGAGLQRPRHERDPGRPDPRLRWPRTSTAIIQQLYETYDSVSRKNFQEAYHDALQLKEEAITAFNLGVLDLQGAGAGRAALLGDLRADPEDRARSALRPRRARGAGEAALRHLLLQLLALPVDARPLGGAPALPHHAHPPPEQGSPRGAPSSPTSPATATARSTSSSTCAT